MKERPKRTYISSNRVSFCFCFLLVKYLLVYVFTTVFISSDLDNMRRETQFGGATSCKFTVALTFIDALNEWWTCLCATLCEGTLWTLAHVLFRCSLFISKGLVTSVNQWSIPLIHAGLRWLTKHCFIINCLALAESWMFSLHSIFQYHSWLRRH